MQTMDFLENLEATLHKFMALYPRLPEREQAVIRDFVANFYQGKEVYTHQDSVELNTVLPVVAANAQVGG